MLDFRIDEERCIQCGECVMDCPARVIELHEYPRIVNEEGCIRCQHCLAVCPTAALSILGRDPDQSTGLTGTLPQPEGLAVLIKGRRSVRRYRDEDVDPEVVQQLLDTAWHAPTGVNAQQVLFTVLDSRTKTDALRRELYERLTGHMQTRQEEGYGMRMLGWAVKMHREQGADVLFRGAPHLLLTSAPEQSPCPVQDTHIALAWFELMAQSMGLGTLWNGMLTWCINDIFPDLRQRLGIPEDHRFGYVMCFGKPDVTYHRTVQRSPARVNRPEWESST